MTLVFEVFNGSSYIALDGVVSIKFSVQNKYQENDVINSNGWLNILDSSGSRSLIIKIDGILGCFTVDSIIRVHALSSSINKYRLTVYPNEKIEFQGIISSYERKHSSDDFDLFSFTLVSASEVNFLLHS